MNLTEECKNCVNHTYQLSAEIIINKSVRLGSRTLEEDADYIFDNPHVRFILLFLYTIVFCLCFFGNLAVVLVVTLHWKMRSVTKFCLGNLAFANLCVGIFCVYQNLSTFLMDRWVFGHFMCKMYHFVNSLSLTASVLILVVICVERYVAILHPFQCRRWITLNRLRFLIVTVWLMSAILCSPRLYYITTYNIPITGSNVGVVRYDVICAPQQSLYDAPVVDMTYFILLFLLPLLLISFFYILIGIHLWRGDKILRRQNQNYMAKSTFHSVRKNPIPNNFTNSNESFSDIKTYVGNNSPAIQTKSLDPSVLHLMELPATGLDSDEDICTPPNTRETTKVNEVLKFNSLPNSYVPAGYGGQDENSLFLKIENEKVQKIIFISPDILFPGKSLEDSLRLESQLNLNNNFCENNSLKHKRVSRTKSTPEKCVSNDLGKVDSTRMRKRKKLKSRQRVIRMLIVIIGTFALCNLPFYVRKLCVNFLASYDFGSDFVNLFSPLTFLLMYSNCAINPIIYAFMSRDFRLSLMDLFRCRLKRRHKGQAENSFV